MRRRCRRKVIRRPMASQLDLAYDHCQSVAREHAKNFYFAFRTLPSKKRLAIYAAYAFCRLCDNIADGDLPLEKKRSELAGLKALVSQSLTPGNAEITDEVPHEFVALADASAAFGIPVRYYEEVIDGVESDLSKTRFDDFEELRAYCYGVASVVGLICIEVFGYDDPAAKQHAIDMGLAMQLTNILRDVKEDAELDRIYIPADEMGRFGYSEEDLKAGVSNDAFHSLMAHQVERARGYYDRSERLFSMLSAESRACPKVLHAAYKAILTRIEASDFDVYSRRIGLSTAEKLMITARLWAGSLLPRVPMPRR